MIADNAIERVLDMFKLQRTVRMGDYYGKEGSVQHDRRKPGKASDQIYDSDAHR